MPDPVTFAHILVLLAALALLWGLYQATIWLGHRASGPGTPQFARGRDGRRFAAWSIVAALLLLALARFTPLGAIVLAGGAS